VIENIRIQKFRLCLDLRTQNRKKVVRKKMKRKQSWKKLTFFLLFGAEKKYKGKNNTFSIKNFPSFENRKINKLKQFK